MCTLSLNTSNDSTTSLSILYQCINTLSQKKSFLISNMNLPWCNVRPFPPWLTWRRCQHPPLNSLLSGSFRGLSWASSSPDLTAPSAAPHKTCAPYPSPASLSFSGHYPGPWFLSCSEGPKTEHSTWVAASPVLNTEEHTQNHLPAPAGCTVSYKSQYAIGFLGLLNTLLVHVQPNVSQQLQTLFLHNTFTGMGDLVLSLMPHPWRLSRWGWIRTWTTWSSCQCSCSL